jgi:Ribbon-helix-helix protein, copG family
MHTTQPVRPKLDERIKVSIAPEDKRRLFETAAARGVTVSQLLRAAIAQVYKCSLAS